MLQKLVLTALSVAASAVIHAGLRNVFSRVVAKEHAGWRGPRC